MERISNILDMVSASIIKDWCDRCKAVHCIYTMTANTAWSLCSGTDSKAVGGIKKSPILHMPHSMLFSPEKSWVLTLSSMDDCWHLCFSSIVARMQGLYKMGIGLTTGFIGSHTVTHNYSIYTLIAPYSSLRHLPSLHTVSSLVSCRPISQDPFACNSATLL
jgi:hypothetical protein